jgi:hypothetical protein
MCVSCFNISPQLGLIPHLHSSIHREIHSSINDLVNIRASVMDTGFQGLPIVFQ